MFDRNANNLNGTEEAINEMGDKRETLDDKPYMIKIEDA